MSTPFTSTSSIQSTSSNDRTDSDRATDFAENRGRPRFSEEDVLAIVDREVRRRLSNELASPVALPVNEPVVIAAPVVDVPVAEPVVEAVEAEAPPQPIVVNAGLALAFFAGMGAMTIGTNLIPNVRVALQDRMARTNIRELASANDLWRPHDQMHQLVDNRLIQDRQFPIMVCPFWTLDDKVLNCDELFRHTPAGWRTNHGWSMNANHRSNRQGGLFSWRFFLGVFPLNVFNAEEQGRHELALADMHTITGAYIERLRPTGEFADTIGLRMRVASPYVNSLQLFYSDPRVIEIIMIHHFFPVFIFRGMVLQRIPGEGLSRGRAYSTTTNDPASIVIHAGWMDGNRQYYPTLPVPGFNVPNFVEIA